MNVWSRSCLFLHGAGADPSRSEPELLRDLGHQEPEPPDKVAAPQHRMLYSKYTIVS